MIHLLIADDEAIIRKGLLSLDWESIGVHIVGAVSNGIEALEMVQSQKVDIVLSDIRMPGMDGIELAQFLKSNELCVKMIFLSGYDDFQYAQEATKWGVSEYILKPTKPEEIFSCVIRVYEGLQ